MKSKIMAITVALALVLSLMFAVAVPVSAAPSGWNVTGTWIINVGYQSSTYSETLVLSQTGASITGISLNSIPPVFASAFTITAGTVSGTSVVFHASYNPNSTETVTFTGTIGSDGSMSGTWADDPGFLNRTGTWASTSGHANVYVDSATVTGEDVAPTVSISAPANFSLDTGVGPNSTNMMVAGWNAVASGTAGTVTLVQGSSQKAAYTVTAQSVSPYMANATPTNLQNYLLIGQSTSGPWYIANGGSGAVQGTNYSGVLTYTGTSTGSLPFAADQYVTPTDALGNYSITVAFTASVVP